MHKKLGRRWLLGTVGTAVMILAAVGWYAANDLLTQNPPGFCAATKRYIADEEFFRTAIALFEWEASRDQKEMPGGAIVKRKDYESDWYQKWERSRSQTDCCQVFRGDTHSTFKRIFGLQDIEVILYTDQENRGDHQFPFLFDVCGRLLPHEFGYHLSPGYGITTRNYQQFITTNTK